eukprot:scaffold1608_cov205-Chaetoceros_neogracile.AAC.2
MEDWRWPYGLLMSPAPPPPANEELLIMELEGFRLLRRAFGLDFSLVPQHVVGKVVVVVPLSLVSWLLAAFERVPPKTYYLPSYFHTIFACRVYLVCLVVSCI